MAYSKHLEADVALRDGSTVHVQPVRPADEDALGEFLASLSIDSRWLRFFGGANMERHGPRRSCRRLPRLLRGTLYSACPTMVSSRPLVASTPRLLSRLSAMVEAHPGVVELDLNPVIATPDARAS
jgi:hypothetical protein